MIAKLAGLGGLLLWGWVTLTGQSITIHGSEPDYRDKTIILSIAWNPFISIPSYSQKLICDENGRFEHRFDLEIGRVVQLETGIYQAYLFVEPGYSYHVGLPPLKEAGYSERISPFYEPIVLPLKVISRTSLETGKSVDGNLDVNFSIARFDSLFMRTNEEIIMSRRTRQKSAADSLIQKLESNFQGDTSLFFESYRRYRYGILKLNQGEIPMDSLSRYYLGPTVNSSNPGFVELFKAVFKDFLHHFTLSKEGSSIKYHINRTHNLDGIRMALEKHPAIWDDTISDMVLIQELTMQFYTSNYHKEAILNLLDSVAKYPSTPEMGIFAQQVRTKLSSLVIGYPPPSFTLDDLNGTSWDPSQSEGKYIYLMFCSPELYGCMIEYPYLQSYHEKHAEYLEVVTVMVANSKHQVEDFMIRNSYDWKALYYDERSILLNDYSIRAYPTAYLIGRDGTLVLSPAPLPSDGFEQYLFRIMRSKGEI